MKKTLILVGMISVGYAYAQNGKVGINTETPQAALDVAKGDIVARGSGDVHAYVGGDSVGNDVELGSLKSGVTDITLYNREDRKAMNLVSGNINARGEVKSTTLSGDGDKIVMANNDGTLVKGVSVSNFATSNIYTADGTLSSDRVVKQAGKWLDFNDGGIRINGNPTLFTPLIVNAMRAEGGGIAVHPNNIDNRIEFATNANGDMRFYQNGSGDVMFIKKTGTVGGLVGIGNTNPKVRLDVTGGGRFKRTNNNSNIEIDTDNGFWGYLDYRRNDIKRWDVGMSNGEETGENAGSNYYISSFNDEGNFLRRDFTIRRNTGNVGIGTDNPKAKLDVVGGDILAGGSGQVDAYFGGDGVGNDVELGSLKSGVTDITLYNREDRKAMKLVSGDIEARGKVKIVDGTQQDGRVLTSDANGVASWQSISIGNKTAHIVLSENNYSVTSGPVISQPTDSDFQWQTYSNHQIFSDEIGITTNNNGFSLPKGKYIVYQSHDIVGSEYCHIQVITENNQFLYQTYYGEWLNASYMINLAQDDNIRFRIRCLEENPSPEFYMKRGNYENTSVNNILTILKLN